MPVGNGPRSQRGGNAKPISHKLTTEAAKAALIQHRMNGHTVESALEKIGFHRKSYEAWRRNDPDFKRKADQATLLAKSSKSEQRGERLPFAEWRKKYLHVDTHWHQLQWVDLLEGRPPRDLHDAQTYEPAKPNRLLVNCPPNHGKSITLTVDYVVYRLCMNPSFRVILISAGAELAQDFLFGVQQRLTSPDFVELQMAYGPDGGFEATAESWSAKRIVFSEQHRASGKSEFHEKDANVLALGMRSKVYGRRADLVIVDDGVDTVNVAEHAKQMKWLRSMVESRLEQGGKLIVIGTRVAPIDLYSELRKPENYANGVVPWTYLASPAILKEGATPAEHETLWPRQSSPWVHPEDLAAGDICDCGDPKCSEGFEYEGERWYARWDGVHLEAGPRASNSATEWALVYQQSGVSEHAVFPEFKVQKATNTIRVCGRLNDHQVGHPITGMNGKWIVAGLDPAIKGFAGIVILAVDRETQKRYVLAAINMKAPTPDELKSRMKELTELYGIHEWRVEKTGLLQFFTQDRELRTYFATKGVQFTEHTTGSNKWDAAFGVASMASLLGEYDKAQDDPTGPWREIAPPLIEFPRHNQDGMKALIHQLITWTPELDPAKVPCDLVMALWFAEIGAREHLGVGVTGNVVAFGRTNKFISPRSKNRTRVNLADYRRDAL